jgi:PelA/Pel-15E family pectate lyase
MMSTLKRCGVAMTVVLLVSSAAVVSADVRAYRDRPDEWFRTDEGRQVVGNIISWQHSNGGWNKGYDYSKPRERAASEDQSSTFDNNATWMEMRILARAHRVTGDEAAREAFNRGLEFIFASQYPTGGWPQVYPPPSGYHRHITFNDGAMTQVMNLLLDIVKEESDFAFVDDPTRQRSREAFDLGMECILAAQIRVDGRLTGWCAQHDEVTLEPRQARAYELPSISGGEGADIVMLLMRIEEPGDRVKEAIHAAAAWFDEVKIEGIRLETIQTPEGRDMIVVEDPAAPPLWGRFYDLETNRPFFCGRDGVKKESLAEIERERRVGYAWLRPWGQKVLDAYPGWVEKHGAGATAGR